MKYQINVQNPNSILIELSIKDARLLELELTWGCDRTELVGKFLQLIDESIKEQADYRDEMEIAMEREREMNQ